MGLGKALRAVIVEDEEGPRVLLKRLLQRRHADVIEVVAEADSGPSALEACETHQPDVIFLDLHLPGFDGFDLLSQLRTEAHVVITTADAQQAVEAYRANAADYLLKPVDPDQLRDAVGRIANAIASERIVRLLCRDREATKVVHLDDVLFLRSDGGYTNVQTEDVYYLLPEALAQIAERLPGHFVRVHRTAVVNIRHVTALDKGNESALLGRHAYEVPISRRHLREFRRKLTYDT
jgi:DNA-binding LytR/AlgR family response regulator